MQTGTIWNIRNLLVTGVALLSLLGFLFSGLRTAAREPRAQSSV